MSRVGRRLLGQANADTAGSPVGPDLVEVGGRQLRVGEELCRSFAVVGYPREVGPGWLEPLCAHPGRLEVSLHVEPVAAEVASEGLRRQLARLESSRRSDEAKGRLPDPALEAAAGDARELAAHLARGEQRLFKVGLVLTVHARDEQALEAEAARLRSLCASLLMDARPATYRSLQGWVTTLPLGLDQLRMRRTFDTAALSAAFPFAASGPNSSSGVLYGATLQGSELLRWDRFALDNHNAVILARSGAGKSYLAKLEALRSLYAGVEVWVIDPEDEYARLAEAVGGAYLHLGAPGVRLNPFDLPRGPDPLTRRALFVHTLVAVLAGGQLDPSAKAALDRGIVAAYRSRGITADPRTHRRPAPTLADLGEALEEDADEAARDLGARLAPFVSGTHRGLFDGPTTTRPEGHLVVISLRDLPDELKPAGTLLALDVTWRAVSDSTRRRRRLVVVDEAWLLMGDPEGARFLFRLAKAARKHWCGLTVVTQDASDLLGTELGQAVVSNAATQVLLRQAPQVIDALGEAFRLSEGEQAFLSSAPRGQGLLACGPDRVAFSTLASAAEHAICTTDPAALDAALPDP